ncbi:FadR/GntR family transcriptional regulator [Rhizobium sp. TRM95796]|uniref:FadR/GntR family transcriptional regulator n=1 Tax=Rhizobium sp. TRM95796 TaxID=2979862 RepID=UPI0021E81A94|nr:FadR/GntR family transcriptional regulator [Rhizobium sp. TRM95796]MCV3767808.1 FadR family transcriptional regulator [Rhizobium sp. TRM95796]
MIEQIPAVSEAAASARRPRVGEGVVGAIARDICSEIYPEGTFLPRENDLCERYGVSRTVIREAIKALESLRLVRSRSKVGTVVCPKTEWNILDPRVLDWIGPEIFESDLLSCILEARRAIEPAAADMAAARASMQDIAELERAWRDMRDSEGEGDLEAFTEADARFHVCLLKASGNRVFLQMAGIIEAALRFSLHASNEAVERHDEAIDIHFELVEALRLRDRAAAADCSRRMLDIAQRDLTAAVERRKG